MNTIARVIDYGSNLYRGNKYAYSIGASIYDPNNIDFFIGKYGLGDINSYRRIASGPVRFLDQVPPAISTLLGIYKITLGEHQQKNLCFDPRSIKEVLRGIANKDSGVVMDICDTLRRRKINENEAKLIFDVCEFEPPMAFYSGFFKHVGVVLHNFTLESYLSDIQLELQ